MAIIVLGVVTVVLALAVIALFSLVYQLIRQQGATLLRLDDLEDQLADALAGAGAGPGGRPEPVPVGVAVPGFSLRDLDGHSRQLSDFAGTRLLLVHWSPTCGFCVRIAPRLAALQDDLRRRKTELVLVANGDRDGNRALAAEHGLRCPILLQDGAPAAVFAGVGTPAAYLLDEHGRVAKPFAIGAPDVEALAEQAAHGRKALSTERPLAETKLVRDGLRAGTVAPLFTLPDLDGNDVSLADLRGRRVVLVFSDPQCGPCHAILPDLERLLAEAGAGLAAVLVTRGDREDNRRSGAYASCRFSVVTQPGWSLSKQYGIFATPVAFLIDEHGVIARDVARGGEEVLALVRDAVRGGKEASLREV